MVKLFKPVVTRKLVLFLKKQESIKAILEEIQCDLKPILTECVLEIPNRYNPGVNWVASWDTNRLGIPKQHVDLLVTLLKFAWLYSSDKTLTGFWQSVVGRELTMFEAGRKLEKEHQQRVDAAHKDRPWPALDNWILQKLRGKKKWTNQALWDGLPTSRDYDEHFYRDEQDIICARERHKSIKFRAFCDHVKKQRTKLKMQIAPLSAQGV